MNKNNIILASVALLATCLLQGCKKEAPRTSAAPIKVELRTITSRSASATQSFSATIEEESGTSLSFATAGTIEHVYVAAGQLVKQGTLIASVDPVSVRNAYTATLATLRQAEDAHRRMKQLHDAGSLPDIQWVEVESKLKQAAAAERIARKSLSDCKLYAPFTGYVAEKPAEVGQNVAPGMPVAKLVRIDRVKAKLAVPEEEMCSIKAGQSMTIAVPALDGRSFTGRVVEKGVEANPLSRSYEVKVLIDNPRHELLPGMVCEAAAQGSDTEPKVVMVPANIVQIDTDNREFVWTAVGGKARKTYITIAQSVGDNIMMTICR